jgi:hypothetical protein
MRVFKTTGLRVSRTTSDYKPLERINMSAISYASFEARRSSRKLEVVDTIERACSYLQAQLDLDTTRSDALLIDTAVRLLQIWLQSVEAMAQGGSSQEAQQRADILDVISRALLPVLSRIADLPAQTPEGHLARAATLLVWDSMQAAEPALSDGHVTGRLIYALCNDLLTSTLDGRHAGHPRALDAILGFWRSIFH